MGTLENSMYSTDVKLYELTKIYYRVEKLRRQHRNHNQQHK